MADAGFEDPGAATYTMALLAACQSLPDRVLPSYAVYRHLGILWLFFFIINFLLDARFFFFRHLFLLTEGCEVDNIIVFI